MTWRLAYSLTALRNEVNQRWPGRDRGSDGTIGNAEHATRDSDHNPWIKDAKGVGVVRALDIDRDLDGNPDAMAPADIAWLAEHLRRLGGYGDQRLNGGGYVIWSALIASEKSNWAWRPYSGPNAHKTHVHVSVTRTAFYDSLAPWGVAVPEEDDMTDDDRRMLREVLAMLKAEQEWRVSHLDPRTSNIERFLADEALPMLRRIDLNTSD